MSVLNDFCVKTIADHTGAEVNEDRQEFWDDAVNVLLEFLLGWVPSLIQGCLDSRRDEDDELFPSERLQNAVARAMRKPTRRQKVAGWEHFKQRYREDYYAGLVDRIPKSELLDMYKRAMSNAAGLSKDQSRQAVAEHLAQRELAADEGSGA